MFDVRSGAQARLHATSAYVPEHPDEWVFFQELSQAPDENIGEHRTSTGPLVEDSFQRGSAGELYRRCLSRPHHWYRKRMLHVHYQLSVSIKVLLPCSLICLGMPGFPFAPGKDRSPGTSDDRIHH